MTERVKPAEFARRMGWNRSTVTRLVQSGRITLVDGLVDVEQARRALADTHTAARPDVAARHAAARASAQLQNPGNQAAQAAQNATPLSTPAEPSENGAAPADSSASPVSAGEAEADNGEPRRDTLTAIKTERERIGLEMDRMELALKRGDLMPRPEVEAALDDLVASVRQGLDNLPHAVAGSLVGQDFSTIHATLRDAIANLMRDMHAQAQRELAELSKGEAA